MRLPEKPLAYDVRVAGKGEATCRSCKRYVATHGRRCAYCADRPLQGK